MLSLFVALICGIARRGAGGGFVTWHITPQGANNLAHGFGACIVAVVLAALTEYAYFPIFLALWFLGTKPTPAACFKLIEQPLTLENYMGALHRMAYFLPLAVFIASVGTGSSWWFLMVFLFPLPYYVGMRLLKDGDSAVEFGEWGYSLIGLTLCNLAV